MTYPLKTALSFLSLIFWLLAFSLLPGCSNNMNRALYESIKTQNEIHKTPNERAMTPTPGYDTYRKERESLKKSAPPAE